MSVRTGAMQRVCRRGEVMNASCRVAFVLCCSLAAPVGCRQAQSGPPPGGASDPPSGAAGAVSPRVVRLSAEAFARAGLEKEVVGPAATGGLVLAPAVLEPDASRVATVGPRVVGRISNVAVNVGDRVRQGALLATVESPDVAAALADAASARTAEQVTRQNFTRERALFEHGISSQHDVQSAEAELARATAAREIAEGRLAALNLTADAPLTNRLPVTSPIGGSVVERGAVVGAPVSPSDVLFRIVDLSSLWLVVSVPETQLREIRRGQTIKVAVDALPDTPVEGRLSVIADTVRPDTRTVDVRVIVPNSDGRLKLGMFARARINTAATADRGRAAVTIASEAVQRLEGSTVVFLQTGEREFTVRRVVLGDPVGDRVIVIDGVKPGDVIVTRGAFILKAEAVRAQATAE